MKTTAQAQKTRLIRLGKSNTTKTRQYCAECGKPETITQVAGHTYTDLVLGVCCKCLPKLMAPTPIVTSRRPKPMGTHEMRTAIGRVIRRIKAIGIGSDESVSGADAVDLLNDVLAELQRIKSATRRAA